jgi:hypothetical protein
MRAIMVSVDYGDILSLTLPYNRHHFSDVMIVTTPGDTLSISIAERNNAKVFTTDSFYADGAVFNKWRALEEGLDAYGRTGWLCIMDADVLWPKNLRRIEEGADYLWLDYGEYPTRLKIGQLCSPLRRMYPDVVGLTENTLPREEDWGKYSIHRNIGEWAGYSQIFHADDPVLRYCENCDGGLCTIDHHRNMDGTLGVCRWECAVHRGRTCQQFTWHDISWKTAGGADSFFQRRWELKNKVRPNFEVLHLGDAGVNWCGRASKLVDGSSPPDGEEKKEKLRGYMRGRRGKAGRPDEFDHEKIK